MVTIENLTASFLKLLSDPLRLKIIEFLKEKPSNITEIQETFNLSQSYVSHQLKKLYNAGIIRYERDGKSKIAHLQDTNLDKLIRIIKAFVIKLEKEKLQSIAALEEEESIEDLSDIF